MKHRAGFLLLAAWLVFGTSAAIAQESRASLLKQLMVEQKIEPMFEQQLEQMRASLKGQGTQMLQQLTGGAKPDAKLAAALDRYMERAANLVSADEYAAVWARNYGAELSDDDLRQLLAHYRSALGRKEVAANQRAMGAFAAWGNDQMMKRATALMADFAKDLDAASR